MMEYCIDTGLYSLRNMENKYKETKSIGSAKVSVNKRNEIDESREGQDKRRKLKCWKCGSTEHFKRDCPKMKKTKEKSWGASCVLKEKEEVRSKHITFLLDSGATHHTCGNKDLFVDGLFKLEREINLETANNWINVKLGGKIVLKAEENTNLILNEVLYWEEAPNLLSVGMLTEQGFKITFAGNSVIIVAPDEELFYEGLKDENEGVFKISFIPFNKKTLLAKIRDKTIKDVVWHARLNHCGIRRLEAMLDRKVSIPKICESCQLGKSKRKGIHGRKIKSETRQDLELLQADCIGPLIKSVDRNRGALVVCDVMSNYLWFVPFQRKNQVPALFMNIISRLDRIFPGAVKGVRTDQGTEFTNNTFECFLKNKGILHEYSAAYVHEENGRIENWNRIVQENIRTLLIQGRLPAKFWSFAGRAMVHVHNRMLTSKLQVSPWERLFGSIPNLEDLRVFGCRGFSHVERETRKKLDYTSVPVIFLGYSDFRDGYYVMNTSTNRIYFTRSFVADEESFLSSQETGERDNRIREEIMNLDVVSEEEIENYEFNLDEEKLACPEPEEIFPTNTPRYLISDITKRPSTTLVEGNDLNREENSNKDVESINIEGEPINIDVGEDKSTLEPTNTGKAKHRYNLRSKVKVPKRYEDSIKPLRNQEEVLFLLKQIKEITLKKKYLANMASRSISSHKGFKSYSEAVRSNPNWKTSYQAELEKLEKRGGLKVIAREDWMKCLPFLEVLTEKEDNISGVIKRKVRMAVRGDLQEDIPDNVYSPTLDHVNLRLAVIGFRTEDYYCRQGDAPGAYLNGRLQKPVYLYLPKGHEKYRRDNKFIYLCPASIYGLAISGKVWYMKFVEILKEFGLLPMKRSPCIFAKGQGRDRLVLILYVDDFIFGCKNYDIVLSCEEFLKEKLQVKCTKDVKKFVGAQFDFREGLFLHQEEMVKKLADNYDQIL